MIKPLLVLREIDSERQQKHYSVIASLIMQLDKSFWYCHSRHSIWFC